MRSAVLLYYLATPLFALLDFALGLNVRATFIESDVLRACYYLLPLACGIIGWKRPDLGARVSMAESGISLACLIISVWMAVFGAGEALAEGQAVSPVLSSRGMINAALSGGALAISFYGNQEAAGRRGD